MFRGILLNPQVGVAMPRHKRLDEGIVLWQLRHHDTKEALTAPGGPAQIWMFLQLLVYLLNTNNLIAQLKGKKR